MKSTFKVLFYLKKGSEKKNGEVMIMARITIDGKLCQFSKYPAGKLECGSRKSERQGCRKDKLPA